MKEIREPSRLTPVIAETDVLVVGSGPGGLAAAVSSARAGVPSMLVERYGCLGGNLTHVGVDLNRAKSFGAAAPEPQSLSHAKRARVRRRARSKSRLVGRESQPSFSASSLVITTAACAVTTLIAEWLFQFLDAPNLAASADPPSSQAPLGSTATTTRCIPGNVTGRRAMSMVSRVQSAPGISSRISALRAMSHWPLSRPSRCTDVYSGYLPPYARA
jgi:hypothetical protein